MIGLNPRSLRPMGYDDDREESVMALRVFAGAVSSALILFAHAAGSGSGAWPLATGFGFFVVAAVAATSLSPVTEH